MFFSYRVQWALFSGAFINQSEPILDIRL